MSTNVTDELHTNAWEKDWILKKRSRQGLIGAGVIFSIFVITVLLSKFNEIRHHRVPFIWKKKIERMIKDVQRNVTLCENATSEIERFQRISDARCVLETAKKLTDPISLKKLSRIDVDMLEDKVDNLETIALEALTRKCRANDTTNPASSSSATLPTSKTKKVNAPTPRVISASTKRSMHAKPVDAKPFAHENP